MRRVILPVLFALGLAAGAPSAAAQKQPIYTGVLNNLAADGHDVVAYFKDGAPLRGSSRHQHDYRGATWRFASAANLAAFKADPESFAPQYGGYCAWAVSQGYTAKGDPRNWKIFGGKLYLNYDSSVQKRWETNIPGFIKLADANWPGVLQK